MNKLEWTNEKSIIRTDLKKLIALKLPEDVRNDAWSPIDVFHHVLLVNQSSQRLLKRLISKSKSLKEDIELQVWPIKNELFNFPSEKAFSIDAFTGTEPNKGTSIEILKNLEISENEDYEILLDYIRKNNCESLIFKHPLAGKLNFYEWLYFGILHEKIHLERIRSDLGIL